MEQATRNRLRNIVTQCRRLLEETVAQALQGQFGIYSAKRGSVHIEDASRLSHLSEQDYSCRQDLLDHLEHIKALGYKPGEALEQLIREIAFTHLNRLCAYKMMEARGLIREAVSRGLKSQGFFFYLAEHPEDEKLHKGGQQDLAYQHFLDWLGGTLSGEIGVLFNPNDPANRIYPSQRVLDEILALINDEELKDIWSHDETIGWVYQYFTPKELRDKARKESQAPRNSYELAFRNQFYTPRYVVEFLTDNTLGRIWYEMRKGETNLKERCRYLVRRPTEIFLKDGEEPPAEAKETREDLSQEELLKQPVYIPHRPKKDPREIKVLDPACGSGHFLLYCFDLLQVIYEEAYEDPDLGGALKKDYPSLEDLRRAIPGLILKHNLHGIDIDLRATQIAALALWLRCQRAYQELGLKNGRPKITRANIVCAEPMPGEEDMRKEFIRRLDDKLGQLVDRIFGHMRLAGEAGSLLKIEEEITTTIREIYGEHGGMFQQSDEERWRIAEKELLKALRKYAEQAKNGKSFRRSLFADDADQGLAFIDLCRMRYDVVLMNPPFGAWPEGSKHLAQQYKEARSDIFSCFVNRGLLLTNENGAVGSITNRTGFYIDQLLKWRLPLISNNIYAAMDLGSGVLDALVEVMAYCMSKMARYSSDIVCIQVTGENSKNEKALHAIRCLKSGSSSKNLFITNASILAVIPSVPLAYWIDSEIAKIFRKCRSLRSAAYDAQIGLSTKDDFRFLRLTWETPYANISQYPLLAKGGEFSRYWSSFHLRIK